MRGSPTFWRQKMGPINGKILKIKQRKRKTKKEKRKTTTSAVTLFTTIGFQGKEFLGKAPFSPITRSSRPEVFCKKGVLKNVAKFTGKHLCQSLLFNKVAVLMPTTLLKKRLWHRCFVL